MRAIIFGSIFLSFMSASADAVSSQSHSVKKVLGHYTNRSTGQRIEYRCEKDQCQRFDIVLVSPKSAEQVIASDVNVEALRTQFEVAEHYSGERWSPNRVVPYLTNRFADSRDWWDDLGPGVVFLVPVFVVTGAIDLVTDVPVQLVTYLGRNERDKRKLRKKILYPEGQDQALPDRLFKKVVEALTILGGQISTLAEIEKHNALKKKFQSEHRADEDALETLSNSKVTLRIQDLKFANELLKQGTQKYISFDTYDYYYQYFHSGLYYGSLMRNPSKGARPSFYANDDRSVMYSHQNTYCAFESLSQNGSSAQFSEGEAYDLKSVTFDETTFGMVVDYGDAFYPKVSTSSEDPYLMSRAVLRFSEKNSGAEFVLNCVARVNTGRLPEAPVSRLMLTLYSLANIEIERN